MSETTLDVNSLLPRLRAALKEDLGSGDLTSAALIPAEAAARAHLVAREAGVVCGLPLVRPILRLADERLDFAPRLKDGARGDRGAILGEVRGPLRGLLAAERTLLNFLQRLSGVATLTAKFVAAVEGTGAVIVDTRKTTPGWRDLEKYAVRVGGGRNHRMGLYDAVLIKDNHIDGGRLSLADAVRRAREAAGAKAAFIEIEVRSLDQLRQVLPAGPDIVMPDNFTIPQLREAVALVRDWSVNVGRMGTGTDFGKRTEIGASPHFPRRPLVEASGGITLETVRAVAETGVDRIAVGALTHSAPALDIALDVVVE